MRTRHDFPIGWRLGAGFGAVLVVMVAFAAFMFASHQRSESAQKEFATRYVPLADAGDALELAVLYVGIGVRAHLVNPGDEMRRRAEQRMQDVRRALGRVRSTAWSDADRASVARIEPLVDAYVAEAAALVSAPTVEATAEAHLGETREAALARIHELVEAQHAKRDAAIDAMDSEREQLAAVGMAAFVLVLAILVFVGFYTLRSIQRPAADLVRIASALRAGDTKPALEWAPDAVAARGDRPNPRSELARIAHAFGAAALALERREARLRADARVAAATASSLRREALAQAVLDAIAEASGARAGAFFDSDDGALALVAGYRLGDEDARRFAAPGAAARAAREGRLVLADDGVAAIPLVFGGEGLGVIALASDTAFDDERRAFLESAAAQVAIGLSNVRAHEKVRRLVEEVQAQNEEIQSQMEEIQAQSEQLQAQNEELHAQAEQISESNALLQRQAGELTQADERKNEFLALLAHELRNPLAAIGNSIFMLGHPRVQPQQAEQARAVIERQMRHLTRMIDDLLDVTRISRGKLRLQRESLDFGRVVREGVEDQRGAVDNAGLALEARTPDEPVPVVGDRIRLGQVLSNLLHNAVKFTPRGGRIQVVLERDPGGAHATLRVVDSGIGIDGSLLQQLFEPFRQGEEAHSRASAGLGLGLALARALVEMHGGHIVAHSAGVGQGAEFVVTLPLEGATQPLADARTFVEAGRRREGIVSEDFGPRGD